MSVLILTVDEVMRTLSNDGQYPFVENDKTIDIVRFAINTGFTDVVLDEHSALRVMYQRPGETEVRAQTLTYYDTDGLRNYYDWQLLSVDLAKKGTLTVALCILRTDGEVEEWHTTPCQIRVLDTIHTDDGDEADESITPTVAQRVAVLETMIQRVASGAPIVVANASAMTDTDQIYVLSTDGNWYYHNGSAWVVGGKYGAVATDTTLTRAGIPADAKVVGDELTDLKSALSNEIEINGSKVVVSELGVINKKPFYAESGDIILVQSVNGESMTPSQIEFYDSTGATIKAFTIVGYGVERKLAYDGLSAACYVGLKNGTAQDIKVSNVSSEYYNNVEAIDSAVDRVNCFCTLSSLGFSGRKYFYAENGDKLKIATSDGSTFTVQILRLYDKYLSQLSTITLTGYGTQREVTLSGLTSSVKWIDIAGGTVQNIEVINETPKYSQAYDIAKNNSEVVNNKSNGSDFNWAIGSLDGNGKEIASNTRIRSEFIPVTYGSSIALVSPNNRLSVKAYNKYKNGIVDSQWINANKYTISDTQICYIRVIIRKDTSDSTITSSDIDSLTSGLTIEYMIPKEVYTKLPIIDDLKNALNGSRYIELEIGSLSAGKPTASTAYLRSKNFTKANAGDELIVSPKTSGFYYGSIYLYTTDDDSGYTNSVAIPTTNANSTWKYIFTEDCYFKFRASNASSEANISPEDLFLYADAFYLSHIYYADELLREVGSLGVDYDTLNGLIDGKFTLAIQTDTHMANSVGYSAFAYKKSDFDKLESVVNGINKLNVDAFVHLGDFIRGYQFDTDFESRKTADMMMERYSKIVTNKAFVIGNHDDGCLYYNSPDYNDCKNVQQVMFPTEQFNRYTKVGLNNKGKQKYYYADVGGVRIITLYQRDFDYSEEVPQIEAFKIGSAQLAWLSETALNTDLPVIILTHAPLLSGLYATSRAGFDEALSAIESFASTKTVIAVLSGHTHAQATSKVNGINHIVFKNGYEFFELVWVDLANRTITCKAVNNSSLSDLNLTY